MKGKPQKYWLLFLRGAASRGTDDALKNPGFMIQTGDPTGLISLICVSA
jgi:hypothetical protein